MAVILNDHDRAFCSTSHDPYELYLQLIDGEHRRTQVRRPQTNGFVEHFPRSGLYEFFRVVLR